MLKQLPNRAQEEVVSLLKDLLKLAEEGDLTNFVMIGMRANKRFQTAYAGPMNWYEKVGMTTILQQEISASGSVLSSDE